MNCDTIRFTRHALHRMFERAITPEDARTVVLTGDVIEDYPNDTPYPSTLLFSLVKGRPLHAVVARDTATGECYVITVYEPDVAIWHEDFRNRR